MDPDNAMNMKTPLIISVFRQALKTFLPRVDDNFSANFFKLKESLDQVRPDHVNLNSDYLKDPFWVGERKAPCTYIEIFEDENINISIFILKKGFRMPLHDHPQMHGLLKVISGVVKIRSFSEIQSTNELENLANSQNDNFTSTWRHPRYNKSLFAQAMEDKICNKDSESCILTPDVSNFHEIEALGGPIAFLDILAPPYTVNMDHNEPRECRYYEITRELGNNIVLFQQTPPPTWFFCDQAQYVGPEL